VGISAVILYIFLIAQGYRLFQFVGLWKHAAILAVIQTALPYLLISWGELHVDSAIAAIIHGTMPLFTIVLAHFFTEDDRLTVMKVIGTFIGFGGLILLVVPSLFNGIQINLLGLLAITFASLSFSGTILYSRKYLRGFPHSVVPTAGYFLSTLYLLPFSLWIEHPFSLPIPSFEAIGSLLALSILSTALASLVFFHIIEHLNATSVSMTSYLAPLIGAILGVVVLNEQLTWNTYVGGIFVIVGVITIHGTFKFMRKFQR